MSIFHQLSIIVSAALLCACASHSRCRFVTIAVVGDAELAVALVHYLEAKGVPAGTEGGLVYDLSVAPGGQQRATQIHREGGRDVAVSARAGRAQDIPAYFFTSKVHCINQFM